MPDIKVKGQLNEHGLPYVFMYAVNEYTGAMTIPLEAVIDTGCAASLIKRGVADILGLKSISKSILQRPIEPDLELNNYKAKLIVNDSLQISDVTLKELTQDSYPCELILGMDIIRYCDFYYNSNDGIFDLVFHTDNFEKATY